MTALQLQSFAQYDIFMGLYFQERHSSIRLYVSFLNDIALPLVQ